MFIVASPRIELGSGASETLILSIVLRSRQPGMALRRRRLQMCNIFFKGMKEITFQKTQYWY